MLERLRVFKPVFALQSNTCAWKKDIELSATTDPSDEDVKVVEIKKIINVPVSSNVSQVWHNHKKDLWPLTVSL